MIDKIKQQWKLWCKARELNTTGFQREHWRQELADYDWSKDQFYGYEWGDPENPQDRLGNYLAIKQHLIKLSSPDAVVLEIGSLGGKWVQYLVHCRQIICVDINELGFEYIRRKLPQAPVRFYLTRGDELKGIEDNSVDLVFSMDTLVRVPKSSIGRYVAEAARVLKPGACVFLHLPCRVKQESVRRGFVDLTLEDINGWCKQHHLTDVIIDQEVLNHGVILQAFKPRVQG